MIISYLLGLMIVLAAIYLMAGEVDATDVMFALLWPAAVVCIVFGCILMLTIRRVK